MTTFRLSRVALVCAVLVALPLAALPLSLFAQTNAPTPSGAEPIISQPASGCVNVRFCKICYGCLNGDPMAKLSSTTSDTEPPAAPLCSVHMELMSTTASLVDNVTFNHHHIATDYGVSRASGCSSCGAADNADALACLFLQRRHRLRDMTQEPSSFGPGVFSNYDISLSVYPSGSGTVIDLFDPMDFFPRRLVDGLDGDVKDGVFADLRSKAIKEVRLLDTNGVLTTDLGAAVTAELRGWKGSLFRFQIINLSTSAPSPTAGQIGDGLHFDGQNDFISLGNPSSLSSITGPITMAAWIKPQATDGIRNILVHGHNFSPNGEVFLRVNGGEYQVGSWDGANHYAHVAIPGGDIDAWVHLAGVYDGTTWRLYRNGVEVASSADATGAVTVNNNWAIGARGTGSERFFSGDLDEVQVYSGGLTAAEVADLHANGTAGPNLVSHWNFTGNIAQDAVGGNHGILGVPQRAGRLTRFEDRKGYGMTLAYQAFTPEQISESPTRQWQLASVTDAHNRAMTFTYKAAQVAGRWVLSRVDLPSGQQVDYTYTDKLTQVALPDGTVSTFSHTPHPSTQTTIVEYNDAAADGTHRKKQVYLTNNNYLETGGSSGLYSQSSMVCRMIVNGAGEVSYFNVADPGHVSGNENLIYEGAGRLKRVHGGWSTRFYKDGWSYSGSGGYEGFSGTMEDTYTDTWLGGADHDKFRQATLPKILDATGREYNYEYDAAGWPTKKVYPGGAEEKTAYGDFQNMTRHEDRLGRVTKYTYDAQGNVLTKEVGILNVSGVDTPQPEYAIQYWEYYPTGHANQHLLRYAFDAVESVAAQATNNKRHEFIYNADQLLVEILEPDDTGVGYHTASTFTYDASKRLKTSADALGRTVTYDYDQRDRIIKTTYGDGSTEETTFGAGANANLVIQTKDRNGNTTTYAYDAHGRVTTTVTGANDPTVAVSKTCTYVDGTSLLAACTDKGDTATYAYDFRHRRVGTTVQPRVGKLLTSTSTFVNNELAFITDAYGRKSYNVYRASDQALIRIVRGTVPADGVTDPGTQTRDLGPNATYIIQDVVLDIEGQLTERIDGRGISRTTAYDSRGRVIEANEAFGTPEVAKTHSFYDVNSNVMEIHHPRSFDPTDSYGGMFVSRMTYTRRNLLKTQTEAFGRTEEATVAYTYNNDRTQDTMLDARSKTWTTLWEQCCQRQFGQAEPLAMVDDTGTPKHGVRLTRHDHAGNITYQAVVKATAAELADLALNCCGGGSFDYAANSLNVVTTRYDARHRPIMRTVWLNAPTIADYAAPPIAGENGVLATNGLTTRYTYDDDLDDGNGLDAIFGGLLTGLSLGSGSDGMATLVTNPEGERTLAISDRFGRQVRAMQLDAAGTAMNSMTTLYDTVASIGGYGDVVETAVANALGHTSKVRADGVGRMIETEDAETRKTVTTFDANGNRRAVRDPNNVGTDVDYDFRDQAIQQTDTRGDATQRKFDKHGNVVETLDAKGQVAKTQFDARDRRALHYDRLHTPTEPSVTQWEYDGNNNLVALTDMDTRKTTYAYDERNLKSKETYPDHIAGQFLGDPDYGIVELAYDGAGRLVRRTDQLGDTCTSTYDLAGRLMSRDYRFRVNSPAGPIADTDSFTYDKVGRTLTATSGRYSNTVEMTYDDAGRKTSEAVSIGGQTYTVGSLYDFADRLTTQTYPDGSVVTRSYTVRHQLQEVQHNGAMVGGFQYDPGMRETSRTFGNGVATARTYHSDNQPASVSTPGIVGFASSYDANKNRVSETITGSTAGYGFVAGYDSDDRLVAWNRNDTAMNQAWTLSPAGDWNVVSTNSVAQSRTHNAAHETTAVDGSPQSFDAKGNLISRDDGRTFVWDFDNRLVSTSLSANATQFGYDALGRRLTKANGGLTVVFVSDGMREVVEYAIGTTPGVPLRQYVYTLNVDDPLFMSVNGVAYYYHSNQQSSSAAISDSSGSVVERYAYLPYGSHIVLQSDGITPVPTSAIGNAWMFTGRRLDPETGLFYYRARYYDPGAGKFLSRDPLGYRDGVNQYQYVHGRPTMAVDPSGTVTWDPRLCPPVKLGWGGGGLKGCIAWCNKNYEGAANVAACVVVCTQMNAAPNCFSLVRACRSAIQKSVNKKAVTEVCLSMCEVDCPAAVCLDMFTGL